MRVIGLNPDRKNIQNALAGKYPTQDIEVSFGNGCNYLWLLLSTGKYNVDGMKLKNMETMIDP